MTRLAMMRLFRQTDFAISKPPPGGVCFWYMIASLRGKVEEKEEKALIVSVNSIGYRVEASRALRKKAGVGDDIKLHIYHHVSSDQESLFGFDKKKDLAYFKLLLAVPSVGPRTAMGILDAAPPSVLEQAVTEDNVSVLTKVSGVGRRTAERVLVELKEKVKSSRVETAAGGIQEEAMEALISLGFSRRGARDAVRKLPKEVDTVEEAVKAVLRQQTPNVK